MSCAHRVARPTFLASGSNNSAETLRLCPCNFCPLQFVGTAAGLACARLVEQLCQGGIPVLSELWSRTSSSSAQQAIAQATAKAMGTPQVPRSACRRHGELHIHAWMCQDLLALASRCTCFTCTCFKMLTPDPCLATMCLPSRQCLRFCHSELLCRLD